MGIKTDPIKTNVVKNGQRYVDKPVIVRAVIPSILEQSLAFHFRRQLPMDIQTGWERQRLAWPGLKK